MRPRDVFLPEYDKYNTEIKTKVILKKFVFFSLFLIDATIITFINVPIAPTNYLLKTYFENFFQKNDENKISFADVNSTATFWSYVEDGLVNKLTYENNEGNASNNGITPEVSALGKIRLRQVKVKKMRCDFPAHFNVHYSDCYGGYSYYSSDDENIDGIDCNGVPITAWSYNYPRRIFDETYHGKVATYDSGGFYFDLDKSKEASLQQINCLKTSEWIKINTRAVFIDFTVFHSHLNMFVIIKLVLEFPPTGGVESSSTFYPVKLFHYNQWIDFVALSLEIIFGLYILYFTIEELIEFCYFKCEYCSKLWNIIDLTIVLLGYVVISMKVFMYVYTHFQFRDENDNNYPLHLFLGRFYWVFNNAVAVLLFLIWMKLFKFFALSTSFQVLEIVLSKCKNMMCTFVCIFLIVLFAFAQAGYLLFGYQTSKFRTFKHSLTTLSLAIIGDFDFEEISDDRIFAPIFFTLFIFFIFFILLNMFLAIIIHSYSEVKNDVRMPSSDLRMTDIVRRGRCCRNSDNVYVPGNEIIGNLRKILRLCKFTDSQIDALYNKYDVDECGKITEADIRTFMAKIKTNIYQDVHDRCKRTAITASQYMCQRKKIDIIDKNIKIMIARLVALEKHSSSRRKRRGGCCSKKKKKTRHEMTREHPCRCKSKCELPKVRVCPKKKKPIPEVQFCIDCQNV